MDGAGVLKGEVLSDTKPAMAGNSDTQNPICKIDISQIPRTQIFNNKSNVVVGVNNFETGFCFSGKV
jgi:hypothetical protein